MMSAKLRKTLDLYRLEDRVLFDASIASAVENADVLQNVSEGDDGGDVVDNNVDPVENEDLVPVILPPDAENTVAAEENNAENMVPVSFDPNVEITLSTGKELVVINPAVADAVQITDSLLPDQEVLISADGENVLDAVNKYLDAHSDTLYDAVHFITHGNEGFFTLNGEIISNETFDAAAWTEIGGHLAENADILIYGCDLAGNEAGMELCSRIAEAANADVAASTDRTGISGNWDLEYNSGTVETENIAVSGYAHNLTAFQVTVSEGSGEGSFYWAVQQANLNTGADEIVFSSALNGTAIKPGADAAVVITDDVTITGNGIGETILGDESSEYLIFEVGADTEVTVRDLTVRYGRGLKGGTADVYYEHGGAIVNAGTLNLEKVRFENNSSTGNGGAVYSTGDLDMAEVSFDDADTNAVYVDGGALTIENSLFNGSSLGLNTAENSFIAGTTFYGSSSAAVDHSGTGSLTIINSTIANGGITSSGNVMLVNTIATCELGGNGKYTLYSSVYGSAAGSATVSADNASALKTYADVFGSNVLADNGGYVWSLKTEAMPDGGVTVTLYRNSAGVLEGVSFGSVTVGTVSGTGAELRTDARGYLLNGTHSGAIASDYYVAWSGDHYYATVNEGVADVIENSLGTLNLVGGRILITETIMITEDASLRIKGQGMDVTVLDGGNTFDADGKSLDTGIRIMHLVSSASMTVEGITFTHGKGGYLDGDAVNGSYTNGGGGAIYNWGTLTVIDSAFRDNYSATFGGAIATVSAKSSLNISNSEFTGNYAVSGGGAIHQGQDVSSYTGAMMISGTLFEWNTTGASGGAIHQGGDATRAAKANTLTDVTVRYNSSVSNGGVIYGANGVWTFIDSRFTDNTAAGGGGVLKLVKGSSRFEDCMIVRNTGASGGVLNTEANAQTNIFLNCTILSNTAATGDGGVGSLGNGCTPIFYNCVIADNTAAGKGGVVRAGNYKGNIHFISSVVTGNSAGMTGGVVHTNMTGSDQVHNIYFVNSIVTGNSAATAGDMIYGTVNVANNRVTYVHIHNSIYDEIVFSADMPDVEELTVDSASVQTTDLGKIFANDGAYTFDEKTGKVTFDFAEESIAVGKGVYIFHDEKWTAIAYGASADAADSALTYVRGTTGAATLETKDYLGYTISGASSIGAYYVSGKERASLHVNTADDIVDDTDGLISFREALFYAQNDTDGVLVEDGKYTITFAENITALTLDGEQGELVLTGCTKPIVVDGSVGTDGLTNVTITAAAAQRLFNITGAVDLTFYHTTLSGNGSVSGNGGIILVSAEGTTITFDCAVMRNGTAANGGGIYSAAGKFTLELLNGSKFLSNRASTSSGGAFYISGSNNILTVKDSILQKNTSKDWCGTGYIWDTAATFENVVIEGSAGNSQGAIIAIRGSSYASMKNVSILNNLNGIYGQISLKDSATLYMESCSVLGNTGAGVGGAVFDLESANSTFPTLIMVNSTVAGTTTNGSIYMRGGEAFIINSIVMNSGTNTNPALIGSSSANFGKLTLINSLYSSSANYTMSSLSSNNHMVSANEIFKDGKNQALTVTDYTAANADLRAQIDASIYTLTPENPSYASVAGTATAYNTVTETPFYYDPVRGNWYNAKTGVLASALEDSWKITTDQKGNTVSGHTAGAVSVSYGGEVIENITDMVVTTAEDAANPFDNKLSLREALTKAAVGDTITFSADVFTAENHTIVLDESLGNWIINKDLIIDGKVLQADGSTVNMILRVPVTYAESLENGQTATASRLFHISAYSVVTINDMELYGGKVSGEGGTIYVYNGQLNLNNVIAGESYASKNGGVIYVFDPNQTWSKDTRLEMEHCQIINGTAANYGGGVYITVDSTNAYWYAAFTDVLFSGNKAANGGALGASVQGFGGTNRGCYLYVDSCTFKGNMTTGTANQGAAIYGEGEWRESTAYNQLYSTIVNSTFTENTKAASTLYFNRHSHTDLINCTIVNNTTTGAIRINGELANYAPVLNSLNSIIFGSVTGSVKTAGTHMEGSFNARYTILDTAPVGFTGVVYADGVNGNRIGGEGITFNDLFTGEWTNGENRTAQTLILKRSGYAAAQGSGVLTAATVWSDHSTGYTTYLQNLYYSTDGTNWLNFADGTKADLTLDARAVIFSRDQVGNNRKDDPTAFSVGAYSAAVNYANLIVTGLDDSTDPDIVTFAEAWAFAKSMLTDAAAANRNLTIQFDSTFFNASAADTTILVDTPLDFKSEEYNLISFTGNGYVTLKAANSANPVFTVSGNDVKLAVSGIDFDSSTIVSVSGDNAQVTVKNTSVSGSAELFRTTGNNTQIQVENMTVSAGSSADFSTVKSGLTLTGLTVAETASAILGSAALAGRTNNNGSMIIGGNVTNSGTFDSSIGSVTYNGSDQNVIAGTYKNLTLGMGDAAAKKTFSGAVTVSGKFTAHGTDGSAYMTIDGGANAFSAGSAEVTNTHWQNIKANDLTLTGNGNTAADSGVSGLTIEVSADAVNITSVESLSYGETLADAAVSGTVTVRGTVIAGTFAFADGDIIPDVADSGVTDHAVVFTPENSIYRVAQTNAKVTVNAMEVDLSGITVQNKIYDGTAVAAVNSFSAGTFTVSGSGLFENADAGTGKTVTLKDMKITSASGADLANYTFTYNGEAVEVDADGSIISVLTTEADISRREVTVSFDSAKFTKTYDGTAALTFGNDLYSLSNVVENESLSLTVSGAAFTTFRAGSAGVILDGLTLAGNTAGNYVLVDADGNILTKVDDLTGMIGKAALTLTVSGTADSGTTVYGTLGKDSLSAAVSSLAATDKLEDPVAVSTSGGISSAGFFNAGTHTVSTAYRILNGTEDVTDCYDIMVSGVKSFTVTQKALTSYLAGSKVYDGSAAFDAAPVALTAAQGVIGNDVVTGDAANVTLTSSGVGVYTVGAENITLGGTDSGNYVLTEDVTLEITARKLTIDTVSDHTYGDTAAVIASGFVSGQTGSGNLSTDTGIGRSGFYNAGTHTVLALGDYRITDENGSDVTANYDIAFADGLSFEVARKTLDAAVLTEQSRTYDKTAQITVSAAYSDSVTGDALTITGTLDAPSVNAGKYNVDAAALTLSGDAAANFVLSGKIAVSIEKRDVEITSVSGLYGESIITTAQGAASFAGTDAFTGMIATDLGLSADGEYAAGTHTVSGLGSLTVADGNGGNNYNIILSSSFTAFTIEKRAITITADAVTVNGRGGTSAPAPELTYTVSGDGLIGTDAFSGSLSSPSLNLKANGSYAITIGSLTIVENTGTESANYEITFVPEKVRVINVVPPAAEENDGGSSSAKRNTAAAISAVNNPDLTSSIYMMASGTFSTEYQNPAMIGMILSAAAAPRHVEQSGFSGSISARYANEEHSAAHIDIRDEIRADRENRAVLESARADGDVLFDGALCHQEDDLRKRLNDIPVQIDSFALFDSFSVDMADSDTGLYWSEEIAGSLPDDRIAENVSGMEDDGMAGVENIRFTMLLNHALPCRDELDETLDALCVVS